MRALQLVSDRETKSVDIAAPEAPAPGEVQLKIRVVALNHLDVWGWRGMAFAKREMPLTIGAEASAEVVALGEGGERPQTRPIGFHFWRTDLRHLPQLPRRARQSV